MNDDLLQIKPTTNLEIIANDNSSFSNSYLERTHKQFYNFKELKITNETKIFPLNYQEDYAQAYRRAAFNLRDWNIICFFVNENDSIDSVLLVTKSNFREGLIFSFNSKCVTNLFYRGFTIQETFESPVIDDDLFLESLGLKEETEREIYFSYDDDPDFENDDEIVEVQNFSIVSPSFEANYKRKIVNLGSSSYISNEDEKEEDNDDSESFIEIEKPTFEGFKKRKIKNLGFSGTSFKKNLPSQPTSISIDKPAFEAISSKKVANLGYSTEKKKKPKPIEKTIVVTYENSSPNRFEPVQKHSIVNYDNVLIKEKRQWSVIDLYKVKPNVFSGERSVINCEQFKNDLHYFGMTTELLKKTSKLVISDKCIFVPSAIAENDSRLMKLKAFNVTDYHPLIAILDSKDNVKSIVLSNSDLTICVDLVGAPSVTVISTNGVSLDDRALPYYTYTQIKEMVGI